MKWEQDNFAVDGDSYEKGTFRMGVGAKYDTDSLPFVRIIGNEKTVEVYIITKGKQEHFTIEIKHD